MITRVNSLGLWILNALPDGIQEIMDSCPKLPELSSIEWSFEGKTGCLTLQNIDAILDSCPNSPTPSNIASSLGGKANCLTLQNEKRVNV